jgi:alkylated DNA repair dioxygenase AlkB
LTGRAGRDNIEHVFASDAATWSAEWQPSLFGLDDPGVDRSFAGLVRHELDAESWVDVVPRWLAGADEVFAELVARLAWRQRVVPMYGRVLDEPRLTWWWAEELGRPLPLPVLAEARAALSAHYARRFDSIGANLYRDGHDSVAWHGDRIGDHVPDPVVAIVSVGAPRPFLLRPVAGGPSRSFLPGQGDLLVMGGGAQLAWQHAVPKVAVAGPRISLVYRHDTAEPASPYRQDLA